MRRHGSSSAFSQSSSSDDTMDEPERVIMSSYDEQTLQQQFYSNMVVEWQIKYLDYKYISDKIVRMQRDHHKSSSMVQNLLPKRLSVHFSSTINTNKEDYEDQQEAISDFKYLLYKEIDKINTFYREREQEMIKEHQLLLEQVEQINEMYHQRQYAASLLTNQSSSNGNKLAILSFNQKQKLKEGIEEHYYNLNLILNYSLVNYNAIVHLCHKVEEMMDQRLTWSDEELKFNVGLGQDASSNTDPNNTQQEQPIDDIEQHEPIDAIEVRDDTTMDDNLLDHNMNQLSEMETIKFMKSQYFKKSNMISKYLKDTIQYYAEYYCDDNQSQARDRLSKMRGNDNVAMSASNTRDVYTSGILSGSLIVLVLLNVFYYFHTYELAPNLDSIEYGDQTFSLYRLILFPTMLSFLIAINIRIWSNYNINYSYILGLNPLMTISTWKFLYISLLLLNLIFLSQLIYMMNVVSTLYHVLDMSQVAYWHPIVLWICFLLYLFNPFKILNFEFRFWLLKCLLRMLAAPFTVVRFSDFFIADQLTSLGDVLFELQFIACIYPATSQFGLMRQFCDSTKSIGLPILNYIPYHCRLMQCLRKYYDTRNKMHLVNATKYATNCLVIILAFVDKLTNTDHASWTIMRTIWLIVNIPCTCLKLYWDLRIDMGLLEFKNVKYKGLRSKLLFHPIYYYMAMVGNIVLRWMWLPFVFIKSFVKIELNTLEWMLYMFVTFELLRRFIWNIFRIEHENIANIENYRATKEIPLPFDTSSRMEQVQSKKEFLSSQKLMNRGRSALEWIKSVLFCFNREDDDDIWIIDEEELEKLRRENAKRPNLKIQLTLPFDLENLKREFLDKKKEEQEEITSEQV